MEVRRRFEVSGYVRAGPGKHRAIKDLERCRMFIEPCSGNHLGTHYPTDRSDSETREAHLDVNARVRICKSASQMKIWNRGLFSRVVF